MRTWWGDMGTHEGAQGHGGVQGGVGGGWGGEGKQEVVPGSLGVAGSWGQG